MHTSSPSSQTSRSTRRIGPIVVGIILFASLMALRHELSSIWTRAAVAGCAFAVLVVAIGLSRRTPA